MTVASRLAFSRHFNVCHAQGLPVKIQRQPKSENGGFHLANHCSVSQDHKPNLLKPNSTSRNRQFVTGKPPSTMLLIDNETQRELITTQECIAVQEDAFIKLAQGLAGHRPRIDVYVPSGEAESYYRWGSMEGAYDGIYACRVKSDIVSWPQVGQSARSEKWHCVRPGLYCGLVFLFSTRNGEPLAMLNDGTIQHLRVG